MKLRPFPWLLLIPVLFFLPNLADFPFPVNAQYSDLAVSHYPNAVFLIRSLQETGQVPLWSPTILSGYPFAANPLSGIWYPPGWLALLFPLPLGFNLLIVLHLLWSGWGFYRLMRAEGINAPGAVSAGVVLMLNPRILAHYGAGHLTLLYALAWTPWLLLAARGELFKRRGFSGEGPLIALIFLADPRWAVYAALLWFAYRLRLEGPLWRGKAAVIGAVRFAARAGREIFAALLIASPLLLLLGQYARQSTRQMMTPADVLNYSLPPARLFGLFAPSFDGNTEWTVYAGALALLMAVWISANPGLRKLSLFWSGVVIGGLIISLGSAIPGSQIVADLPGFSLLRVPARFILLAAFGFAALAGYGVHSLYLEDHLKAKTAFWSRLLTFGTALFVLLTGVGAWIISGKLPLNFLISGLSFSLTALWISLRDRGWIAARLWWLGSLLICLVDLGLAGRLSIQYQKADQVLSQGQPAAAYLTAKNGRFRVYSPSYSLPQQTAARLGVELADGVDPLQLLAYQKYMETATGIPSFRYSVTLPPFEGDDLASANQAYQPDVERLGYLNIRYVLAEFDLTAPGLVEETRQGSNRIYRVEPWYPRAWVEQDDGQMAEAALVSQSANEITINARGPGRLVLSELVYPGWRAEVNGKEAEIRPAHDILRSVALPNGDVQVVFRYSPPELWLGLIVAGGGLLAYVLLQQEKTWKIVK